MEVALKEAHIKAKQLADGQYLGEQMDRGARENYVRAIEICGKTPLLAALEEWKKARDLTNEQVIPAAKAWAAKNGTAQETVVVKDAVGMFMKAKKRAGVDVTCSYQKILPSLEEALGDRSMNTVSSRELTAWMDGRYPHPLSRNTARKRVVTLWRWARRQGFLPRDALTEAEQTEASRVTSTPVGVISGATYTGLLEHIRSNKPKYLGPLVLAGFCGLRRSEILGQTWEDVNVGRAFVRVTTAKRNTPSRRLVPLSPVAIEWLKLCRGREGSMCSDMATDRIRAIGRTAQFVLPDNCFRHSFISHRVAQTGNVAETALEAGNSPTIIFQNYRELFDKADGEAWFAIKPRASSDD